MKSFAVLVAFVACFVAACAASGGYGGGAGGYGSASIPAPPCPKNYLFSCQPNLTPAPCAAPAAGYGGSGSYSQQYPIYSFPQNFNGLQVNLDEN